MSPLQFGHPYPGGARGIARAERHDCANHAWAKAAKGWACDVVVRYA